MDAATALQPPHAPATAPAPLSGACIAVTKDTTPPPPSFSYALTSARKWEQHAISQTDRVACAVDIPARARRGSPAHQHFHPTALPCTSKAARPAQQHNIAPSPSTAPEAASSKAHSAGGRSACSPASPPFRFRRRAATVQPGHAGGEGGAAAVLRRRAAVRQPDEQRCHPRPLPQVCAGCERDVSAPTVPPVPCTAIAPADHTPSRAPMGLETLVRVHISAPICTPALQQWRYRLAINLCLV